MVDWVRDYLAACRRRGVSEGTCESYRRIFERVRGCGVDLAVCSKDELIQCLDRLRGNGGTGYYRLQSSMVRSVLRFLGRRELADLVEVPRMPRVEDRNIEVLTREEVERMIKRAVKPRDRLLLLILFETGARRGEIYNLRIKSVQFDEYSAILTLTGKTGTRRRRVYSCVPELRQHINDHPHRDDPEAHLFLNEWGRPLSRDSIYQVVKRLGQTVLKKRIKTHIFRHTRATEDVKLFTDREAMKLFGWSTPSMVRVYSHLTMKDVDEKDLVLHGLKKKEEILKPLVQVKTCPGCKFENAPIAVYCAGCGAVLADGSAADTDEIVNRLIGNVPALRRLFKAAEKIYGVKLTEVKKKESQLT